METSPIRLGMSTSVLNGYDPSWLSGDPQSGGLFTTTKIPLSVQDPVTPAERGKWTYPVITLHDNADLLLNELFPGKIDNPGNQTEEVSFSAGALLTGNNDRTEALAKLKKHIGIDLSVSGRGYALVRLMRKDATLNHPSAKDGLLIHAHPVNPDAELGVMEEFRQAMSRLRPCLDGTGMFHPAQMTTTIAGEYLDFFYAYGTHYVSGIDMGDCIFQVFAYDADKYARVKKAMNSTGTSFDNENAGNFAYYTTSMQNGPYGYTAETGNIVSFSNDAALAKSLKAKQWQEPQWAKGNSIFAVFKDDTEIDRIALNDIFTQSVPISFALTTLTIFAEIQRRNAWSRILSGAVVHKYPAGTQPNLKKYFRSDNAALFGNTNYSGFASAIATPNINVYKPRLNAEQLTFVAADTVQNLVVSANLLVAGDDTPDFSLPGNHVVLSAQSVSAETRNKTTVINIPGKVGKDATVLYCNQFYGICRLVFAQEGKSQTILDGLMLTTEQPKGNARGIVKVAKDIRVAPPAETMADLKQNIQFSYTFLQSSFHSSIASQDADVSGFLKSGMQWIVKQIPADTNDLDLLKIRLMALDLSTTPDMPYRGAYVPLLTSEKYEKQISAILGLLKDVYADRLHVQDMLEIRRTQEMVIDVGQTLNENIISSGKSLVQYIDTTAHYQQSMSGYYDAIAQSQEKQYRQMLDNIGVLTDSVEAQQEVVNTAIKTYKDRVTTWITMTAISATFEIISGVFSAAGGGGGGAASTVKEVTALAKTIEKIKKIVTVLAALAKAYQEGSDAARKIKNANTALEGVDEAASLMLSQREWDEMMINLDAIMGGGPGDGSVGDAKRELLAAYKVLMLRGKSMLDAQGRANQLAWDLFNSQKLHNIAKEQANELKQIKAQFTEIDPEKFDTSKVDLVGMTSSMDMLQNQMLTMMAKAFSIKDQALQYQYLQPSTPIRSFDLFGFQTAIVMQEENTLQADKERSRLQPGDTSDIDYLVEGVPVSEMTNGNSFRITVGLDSKEFFEYVSARVTSLVASVSTKVNTPSGKFLLHLRCVASPFFDRNGQREKLTYHSEPREKTYEYESGTMQPKFSDNGTTWSKGVNPVTPFSVWEISFPDTQLNKDISFASTLIDIRLTFRLNALIKDAVAEQQRKLRSRGGMMAAAMKAAGTDARPSATAIVAKMAERGTVTNNWDVVYNMSLDKINTNLTKQFDKYKADPQFSNRIKIEVRTRVKKDLYAIKKFDITYGYPNLSFLANNPNNASLTCMINGSITECTEYKTEPQECDPPIEMKQETLTAIIPLSKVTGVVSPSDPNSKVYSVLLNMADGTFSADNMDLSDEEKMEFNMQLKSYFINHPIVFIINSLDLSKISSLEDLRPHEFLFKTLITQKGSQILQLFIQTGNRFSLNPSQAFLNDLPEPIPATFDSSLIISSKVFFEYVLPHRVQGGWKLTGVDPANDHKPWTSKFTAGSVKGTVDTSGLTRTEGTGAQGVSTTSTTWVYMNEDGSNNINWSVAGMVISPTAAGTLHLDFSQTKNVPFFSRMKTNTCVAFNGCKETVYSPQKESSDVKVTITAAMPVVLGGAGRQQTIGVSMNKQEMNIDGRMSGGGFCGCDDTQAQLNRAMRDQVPDQITKVLNISFEDISVFALKNLLFPAENIITFKSVYTPGDMVIFGEFA